MNSFTHLDEKGQMHMVEVGDKPETLRRATAACRIVVGPKVYPLLLAGRLPKGDVWAAARLAGIMAAKQTSQLIPLCHPLPLTGIDLDFIPEPEAWAVAIRAKVSMELKVLTTNDLRINHLGSRLYLGYRRNAEELAALVAGTDVRPLGVEHLP